MEGREPACRHRCGGLRPAVPAAYIGLVRQPATDSYGADPCAPKFRRLADDIKQVVGAAEEASLTGRPRPPARRAERAGRGARPLGRPRRGAEAACASATGSTRRSAATGASSGSSTNPRADRARRGRGRRCDRRRGRGGARQRCAPRRAARAREPALRRGRRQRLPISRSMPGAGGTEARIGPRC